MILKIREIDELCFGAVHKSSWVYVDNITKIKKEYGFSIKLDESKKESKRIRWFAGNDGLVSRSPEGKERAYGVCCNDGSWSHFPETSFLFYVENAIKVLLEPPFVKSKYDQDKVIDYLEEIPLILLQATLNEEDGRFLNYLILRDYSESYILNDQGETIEKIC
jgi:hypothetical protein